MSELARMIGDEMVDRPPLTIAQMKQVIASGRSIIYHGKGGTKIISRISEIPSIETLVADGFADDEKVGDEIDQQIKALKEQQAALERARAARNITTFERAQAEGPPNDSMEDIKSILKRRGPGRPPKPPKSKPDPGSHARMEIEETPEESPTGINENS